MLFGAWMLSYTIRALGREGRGLRPSRKPGTGVNTSGCLLQKGVVRRV
jgi:hypothetical protein